MLGAFTPRKPCCSYGCAHWVIIESAFLTLGHGQKLRKPWLSRWLSKLQFPAVLTIYLCKTFLLLEARLDPAAKQTVTLPKLIWKEAFLYGCFCHNCLGFCVFLCPLSTCRSWEGRCAWIFHPNGSGYKLHLCQLWKEWVFCLCDFKRWLSLLPFSQTMSHAPAVPFLSEAGDRIGFGPCWWPLSGVSRHLAQQFERPYALE